MTDGETGGGSRLERLRQKHKALLSTSSRKIAASRGRLGGDFDQSGRKLYIPGDSPAGAPIAEGNEEPTVTAKRSSTTMMLKEENKKLKEELKELQAEREKLRKNLSNVAVQVQNASKAILSTKVHEANAKLSAMEIDLKETQERLDAKEASQNELLIQMQKLRKENAKLGSQVRLNSHSMSGTKNNKIKELADRVTELEETNRDLTLEKAKLDAQLKIEQEDGYEDMKKAKKKGDKALTKEEKTLARIRQSNMTMIQTQLAVSSAQLTSAEMELADKEHEIETLTRNMEEMRKDNNRLRKIAGEKVDPEKVGELEKEVKELESVNKQLLQEKMEMSLGSIQEDLSLEDEEAPAASGSAGSGTVTPNKKLQKRVRDSNLSMMKTQVALANAQASSVSQELAEKEHEMMDMELRLAEANKALDHALSEKREAEKKLQDEKNKAYELEKKQHRAVTLNKDPEHIPTNIAVGMENGALGGTFDFGAIAEGASGDASLKIINVGGDDQTAKSAMTGFTDASSMAQTYAVTIVQTKLADSHAKYAELEVKYNELKNHLDTAMVEIGTVQTSSDQQAADLSAARDKNAAYQAEMNNLKAQIAVLEDKQIKALKRQMRKARRAEEDGDDEDSEEEEVIPLHEHRSTVAILNTKLQEANVKMSSMEREMDELADMLESTLIDGEGKRAIINALNEEISETRQENAELYTQVQEFEAMNEVFEGARILELETKLMGLEMMNQQLMLQQLEDEDAAASAVAYGVMDDEGDEVAGGTKVEKLERKIRGLEQMNKVLSNRNLMGTSAEKASSAPSAAAIDEDDASSASSS